MIHIYLSCLYTLKVIIYIWVCNVILIWLCLIIYCLRYTYSHVRSAFSAQIKKGNRDNSIRFFLFLNEIICYGPVTKSSSEGSGHNICFYEEIWKIIPELQSNLS